MRVVAGTARGRRLEAPPGRATRPTTDRVREAVFNALVSLDAVEGASVADLFAGSGALGIEALSRGAAHCVFVERDRRTADLIRANLAATDLADRAEVRVGDAVAEAAALEPLDLVLADPPYAFDGWAGLLQDLPATTVVIESDRTIEPPPPWVTVREKRYGSTVVLIARRGTSEAFG